MPPFKARTARGTLSIDPSSYHRYDRYAQAVSALDARGTVRLYETLKPRINEADKNFGGSGEFNGELERAIVELLKVPVVEGPVELKMSGIVYAYADPRLEGLSPPQKQLLRMGPENVRTIQTKLREIAFFRFRSHCRGQPHWSELSPAPAQDHRTSRRAIGGLSPGPQSAISHAI